MKVLFVPGLGVLASERGTSLLQRLFILGLGLGGATACGRDEGSAPGREHSAVLVQSAGSLTAGAASSTLAALSVKRAHPPGRKDSRKESHPELPELDSHRAALERQLLADWGQQSDRDGQAAFPLVDSKNWRRVRFRGVPTFTAFTYGSDHNAITSAFAVPVQGEPSSRKCMALFEARAMQELDVLGGKRGRIREKNGRWNEQELLIHAADGELDLFFKTYRFSVAWAAYPGYSNGCIVYSTVVLWGDEPKLAKKVRDRWVREGFERYVARTPELPYRH